MEKQRKETRMCPQCKAGTLHVITEKRDETGRWVEAEIMRVCGHNPDEDPLTIAEQAYIQAEIAKIREQKKQN